MSEIAVVETLREDLVSACGLQCALECRLYVGEHFRHLIYSVPRIATVVPENPVRGEFRSLEFFSF
jgi:hypothetical protein